MREIHETQTPTKNDGDLEANMTVKQLVEMLSTMDQELLVLTRSYEGGMDIVNSVELCNVEYKDNQPWYYGDYWSVSDKDIASEKETIKAVFLGK